MNPSPPNACCLDESNHRELQSLRGGRAVQCSVCQRHFFTAEMFMDEACIQPISLRLLKEMEGDAPDAVPEFHVSLDLVAFIMEHKPYYALNNETGKLNAVV